MRPLPFALVFLLAGVSMRLEAEELAVIAPVMEDGRPLQAPAPNGKLVPVVERVRSGHVYAGVQSEAAAGFTHTILALDRAAQRLAGTDMPVWLYLAVEDGGFARQGFWLRENGEQRFLADHYVDLIVDEASIADGSFEEIFAHEMGHVFLRRLLPSLPHGYSRTPHSAMSVTDPPTAFDEGFAMHFQGLVRRCSRNAALRDYELGLEGKPIVGYWWSNLDRATRIEGMRRNWFVQAQLAMPGVGSGLARQDQSTLFDTARLKNAAQMLSSEGVIATLFYRWLVPGSADEGAIVERYARLFEALRAMNRAGRSPDAPVFLDLADAYRALHRAEADRLLAIIVDTTHGATADPSFAARVETLAAVGRLGDIERFVAGLQPLRAELTQLRTAVLASPARLRAALGPDIWLLADADGQAASVNLNTAELEGFLLLPGFDAERARRALEARRGNGPFRNLADFAKRTALPEASRAALADMQEAMRKAGTYARL